jgi:TRAP transporter 4TM/12TM fusion protein
MKLAAEPKKIIAGAIAVCWILYQLYLALISPLHPLLQNPLHLMFALGIVFVYYPTGPRWWRMIDGVAGGIIMFIGYYYVTETERIQTRIHYVDDPTQLDVVVMFLLIAILLEAVRRTLGLNLLFFIVFFITYAGLGQYFPGWMNFQGIDLMQFTELMTMGPDGIMGIPLSTSADFLFFFIMFGAFFAEAGGGKLLIDIGLKFSNARSGGPAKAAVISSGLMGMISGSAVANVTTTGVLTIPMMKKAGYTPEQAAAVEAIASTGGQIMPPIMGVGAFIMAEMLGIKYTSIALAAIIPALAYYFSVFLLVDFIAKRKNIVSTEAAIAFEVGPILPRLYLLIPAGIVVYYILSGSSLMRAALLGIAGVIVVNFFNRTSGLSISELYRCAVQGAKQAASIALPTAACGIIIGIVIQSGLATKLSGVMIAVGGNNLLIALLLAMSGCMLLGMALPTVAAYLVSVVLFVPTLIKLGITPLPANMFVFYFGIIAQITPPVCLASFTAAGIAGANSWKTGWLAFAYCLVAFLVPFVFVYQPSILLMGTVYEIITNSAILAVGTYFLAAALAGYLLVPLYTAWERLLLLAIALLIITPEMISSIIGIGGGACFLGLKYFGKKKALSNV